MDILMSWVDAVISLVTHQYFISGLVGVFISIVVNTLWKTLHEPKEMNRFRGKWNAYFYAFTTEQSEPEVNSHVWEIKRGIRHRNIIEISNGSSNLRTKGFVLKEEKNHFIVQLEGITHVATSYVRFEIPGPQDNTDIDGICLTYGHDGKVATNGLFLSKNSLNDTEILEKMSKKYKEANGCSVFRLS